MDDTRSISGAGSRAAYVKPVLRRHGTIKGLTKAYLQGPPPGRGGGPPDSVPGPPPGVKYVGDNDFSRSAKGA